MNDAHRELVIRVPNVLLQDDRRFAVHRVADEEAQLSLILSNVYVRRTPAAVLWLDHDGELQPATRHGVNGGLDARAVHRGWHREAAALDRPRRLLLVGTGVDDRLVVDQGDGARSLSQLVAIR